MQQAIIMDRSNDKYINIKCISYYRFDLREKKNIIGGMDTWADAGYKYSPMTNLKFVTPLYIYLYVFNYICLHVN